MKLALLVTVELHEDEIPDLDVAGHLGRERIIRLPRLEAIGAVVVEDFRARPAGPGVAHLPKVVLLAAPLDALQRDSRDLRPEPLGIVVIAEDGDIQPVFGQAVDLRDQFPGETDSVFLEVVTEREVAQHLEERVVSPRAAHVLEVVMLAPGPDALLRSGRARVRTPFVPGEDILELVHPGVGEQQCRVVRRH